MKYMIALLFLSFEAMAITTPDLKIDGATDNSLLYGYKVNVYTQNGEMLFSDRPGFFVKNNYLVCLTPVIYGTTDTGTHIDGCCMQCYFIQSPQ